MNNNQEITAYNESQTAAYQPICELLFREINKQFSGAESKIWHRHPVWFLEGNPIVGYSIEKRGVRLMFWNGQSFDEENLSTQGKKFKDASIFYTDVSQVNTEELERWLEKSKNIQWDYKNLIKRKGEFVRLK